MGIKHYEWKGSFRVLPVDFNFSNSNSDLVEGALIKEYELYFKNRIRYNTKRHIVNLILETKYSKPYKYNYFQYIIGHKKEYSPLFSKKVYQKLFSVALEDLFIINNNFSVIYGGRYSHYNDFGNNFAYKLGSVYNFNKQTTFKLLFNTAFRAPSWVELYANTAASFNGNSNLKSEKIKMLEFSYLQKFFRDDQLKFTIYRGKSINYIGREISSSGKEVYNNLGNVKIQGFEISYRRYYNKGNFNINYSYNNNKNLFNINKRSKFYYMYSRIRKRLIKGYNIYNINNNLSFFSGFIYEGKLDLKKKKNINFNYFTLNTNIDYHKNNYNITIGIDNLTNHKNYYFTEPSDVVHDKYIFMQENSGLPTVGRKIYISLIKKW